MIGIAVLLAGAIVTTLGALSILGHPGGLYIVLALGSAAHWAIAAGMIKRATWAPAAAITVLAVHVLIVLVAAAFMLHMRAFGGSFSLVSGSGAFDPFAFVTIAGLSAAVLAGYASAIRSILRYEPSRSAPFIIGSGG